MTHTFDSGGLFTILVALAHGVAFNSGAAYSMQFYEGGRQGIYLYCIVISNQGHQNFREEGGGNPPSPQPNWFLNEDEANPVPLKGLLLHDPPSPVPQIFRHSTGSAN